MSDWTNETPIKPGWYSLCIQKDWRWYPSDQYPFPVRIDFVNGELMIVEDPEQQIEPVPQPLDDFEDQMWMCRAFKPLADVSEFDSDDLPDVDGNPKGWEKKER